MKKATLFKIDLSPESYATETLWFTQCPSPADIAEACLIMSREAASEPDPDPDPWDDDLIETSADRVLRYHALADFAGRMQPITGTGGTQDIYFAGVCVGSASHSIVEAWAP